MIANDFGDTYEVSCDRCSSGSEEFEAGSWSELMLLMSESGWRKTNKSGTWENICPDCVEGK